MSLSGVDTGDPAARGACSAAGILPDRVRRGKAHIILRGRVLPVPPAPLGTPIYASGNGVIDKVGWESGYGKYVRVRHAHGYETAYGHMTAFARSTQPGARVRQGQVIGYVGSTGLSTGPHLHYEILVNGRFVDPLRLKLPRGRVLDGAMMANFEQERDRLDNMIARNSRFASSGQAAR